MVCPHCATKYDDEEAVCQGCGEQNMAMKPVPAAPPVSKPSVGRRPR